MCVICHAAKKRHMKRLEVIQAMKVNSAGFFMAALKRGGARETLRTLDEKEALAFFDRVPDDDEFVMHARIPSYGPKSLDNVHGWEEDGIVFMHNMSLHNIDGFMDKFPEWKQRTDSEFFFRKMFIPYYRGLGKEAYANGRMHPDLHAFVDWVCGTGNRFLFIMPDNRVIRFGTWVSEPDRKENGETAFWASNSSYKTYEPSWAARGQGGTPQSGGGFCRDLLDDEADYYGWETNRWAGCQSDAPRAETGKSDADSAWAEDGGQTLRNMVGDAEVCKIALRHLVAWNLVEARAALEIPGEGGAADVLNDFLPDAISGTWMRGALDDAFAFIDTRGGEVDPGTFVACYADELQRSLAKSANNNVLPLYAGEWSVRKGVERFWKEMAEFERLANLSFDWDGGATTFATAFYMTRTRAGKPKMEAFCSADLICGEDETVDAAASDIDAVLTFIRAEEADRETKKGKEKEAKA